MLDENHLLTIGRNADEETGAQKELKLKMKTEARKQKRLQKETEERAEEMRKLEELTRPDKSTSNNSPNS